MKHHHAIGLALALAACNGYGSSSPPAEPSAIEKRAYVLDECRSQGREAGSYAAYEACKADAGVP